MQRQDGTELLLPAVGMAVLFLLDLMAPREVSLLTYFWLPVLLATAYASPRQVTALNFLAFAFSIASGIHFRYYNEADYWARLLFLAGVSWLAVHLCRQRHRAQVELQIKEEQYRLLAENASDVVFRIDQSGTLEWISSSVEALLGWKASELVGRSILGLIDPNDIEILRQSWLRCASNSVQRVHYRVLNSTGQPRWVSVTCRSIYSPGGQLQGRIGSWSNANDEVEARERILEQQQLLETILDNVDSHVYMKDAEHRYLYANRHVQELYGRPLTEIIGFSDRHVLPAQALDAVWSVDEEVLRSGASLQCEELIPSASGEPRWFLSSKMLVERNGTRQLVGVSTDITDRQRSELNLERSEHKFRLLFEASLDATMLVTASGQFIDANPAAIRLYGAASKEELLCHRVSDFSPEFQDDGIPSVELIPEMIATVLEDGSHQFEWLHQRLDTGERFLGLVTLKAIVLNDEPALLSVVRDISEARRYEERLRNLAYRDELTGLHNRAATLEHLQRLLDESSGDDASMLVLVNLDFDGFQAVNESFGLKVGNRVLIAAAEVLAQYLQPQDWLARLESDEFLVIRRLDPEEPMAAVNFGHEVQKALAQGMAAHSDLPTHPSTSVGLSVAPGHGREAMALLQAANTALMHSKASGKGNITLYDLELGSRIQRRLDLEVLLERALDRQQLRLVFQAQVNASGKLNGAEALLRWNLHDGTAVRPDEFIPLAEQTGQMHRIGEWVIEAACIQLASWKRQGLNPPRLAINLSAVQFESETRELDALLTQILSRHGIAAEEIELEVTETALLRKPQQARKVLQLLGIAGFSIAMDDFGTGYSSLVNLHTLPIHKLKIDKSFVDHFISRKADRALIESILVIARKLGLETIAEGVETDAQWQALRTLGCDSYQGYLFGRPMPPEEFALQLSGHRGASASAAESKS